MDDQDFSSKIGLCQFVATIVLQLHAKFRGDPMTGYREKLRTKERTDGRTDERTDMGLSIGPTSKVGGSKNNEKNLSHIARRFQALISLLYGILLRLWLFYVDVGRKNCVFDVSISQ